MQIEKQEIERVLARVFDELQKIKDPTEHARTREDFVFHMVDWIDNLEELFQLYANPKDHDIETSNNIIIGFLYHVIPHLNVAGRLLLDTISNPFKEQK
jgi:hypothetical protein